MNRNTETATGREKLLILERKLRALYKMEPDLMADKPYRFSVYVGELRLPVRKAAGTAHGTGNPGFPDSGKTRRYGLWAEPPIDNRGGYNGRGYCLHIRPDFLDETGKELWYDGHEKGTGSV